MPYQIHFKSSAWKVFRKLRGEIRGRLSEAVLALGEDPRPPGSKRITGKRDFYRIRVGAYRVVYEIQDEALVVIIIKIGHRRDIYRDL